MAFKFVVFSCFVALAQASPSAIAAPLAAAPVVAAPVVAGPALAKLEEFDPAPQYRFGYDVADDLTGDYKSQTEQRDGDLVRGSYSLVDPDGTRRTVDYSADSINGFNAVVRKEPLVAATPAVIAEPAVVPARIAAAPLAAPVVAARYAAAPVAPVAAPIAAAPVVAKYAAAPVAPVAAPVVAARYAAAPVAPVAAPFTYASYSAPVARFAAYTSAVPFGYPAPVARVAAPYAAAPIVAV